MRFFWPIVIAALPLVTFGQVPFSLQDRAFITSTSPLRNGLAGYWRLEEASGIRYDFSKNGNHLNSNNSVGQTAGKVGNCATFTAASSQYLSRSSSSSLSFGDSSFTIACWFFLTATNANKVFVAKDNFGASTRDFNLLYRQSTDRITLFVFRPVNSAVTATANSFGSPGLNGWHFVVAWHDASADTVNIQVDGGTVDTTATGGALQSASAAAFTIGALADPLTPMDGRLDEVGVWNRVLTSTERSQLYRSGNGVTFPRFSSYQFDWSSQIHISTLSDANTQRSSLIGSVFGGGGLPNEIGTLSSVASPVAGLSNLDTTQKITMTAYPSRPRLWTPTSPDGSVMVLHQGHTGTYNSYQYGQALQTYLNAGVAVCGLVMPGGVDEVTSGTSTEHNTGAYSMDEFIGPVVVAVNTLVDMGYTDIFMSGLSGGGWTTVLASAADTRIDKAFPTCGSLPLYDPPFTRDFEQLINERGISQTYLDLYILGSLPSRRHLQINYINDDCCFNQAQFNAGPDFRAQVAYVASNLGGSYEFLWQNYTTHQFEPDVITTYILPEL